MKFSIIIPTFNGLKKIERLLNRLEEQYYSNFEVIAIVDGSTDNTEAFLKKYHTKFPFTFLVQKNKGRSGARNEGSKLANGEYLVFFDDDVIPSKNILSVYSDLTENSFMDVLVGRVEPLFTKEMNDFQHYCCYLNKKWKIRNMDSILTMPYITANNFIIRRDLFLEFNGFDERLTDAEDFELAVRLFEKSHHIYFCKDAVVNHELFGDFKKYIQRQIEYKNANYSLVDINMDVLKYRNIKPISIIRRFAYAIFYPSLWVDWIEKEYFKWLPRGIRFQLYSKIIYAQKELRSIQRFH